MFRQNFESLFAFLKWLKFLLNTGCLIAELQVLGVKANYMKRPYDSTTSFAVHGVHLVDAIQSFGPEYELLFSSCKPQLGQSSNNASFAQSRSEFYSRSVTAIFFNAQLNPIWFIPGRLPVLNTNLLLHCGYLKLRYTAFRRLPGTA